MSATNNIASFGYKLMGNRIAKHVLTSANVLESSTYYILDAQGNVMSTYEREIISASIYYSQKERYIYGSSRLGLMSEIIPLYGSQNSTYSQAVWNDTIGKRSFELSNHLGNVLTVISDRKIPVDSNTDGTVDYYEANIISYSDYYPFGSLMPGRNGSVGDSYRYGFQNQEVDSEVKGEGNSVNYKYRMHDPRLGRFFAVDPLAATYPYLTPYQFSSNSPIYLIEVEGLEGKLYTYKLWYDNDGKHSVHLETKTVDGLKSDLIKTVYKPFGLPNAAPIELEYSYRLAGGKKGSSVTYKIADKPSIKQLNAFFGNNISSQYDYKGTVYNTSDVSFNDGEKADYHYAPFVDLDVEVKIEVKAGPLKGKIAFSLSESGGLEGGGVLNGSGGVKLSYINNKAEWSNKPKASVFLGFNGYIKKGNDQLPDVNFGGKVQAGPYQVGYTENTNGEQKLSFGLGWSNGLTDVPLYKSTSETTVYDSKK